MSETRMQYWQRRSRELNKLRKAELCVMYRKMGGLGGIYQPEQWRKDEVMASIVDIEWDRLPEDQKLPDPPRLTPPCDVCGQGENATPHRYGGEHHYTYTFNPDAKWVPESEAEAERLEKLANPNGGDGVKLKPNSAHYEECSADEDPDGETMCVCDSIAAEPKPDPREEIECTPELIDGRYYGCGVCEACNAVTPQ